MLCVSVFKDFFCLQMNQILRKTIIFKTFMLSLMNFGNITYEDLFLLNSDLGSDYTIHIFYIYHYKRILTQ